MRKIAATFLGIILLYAFLAFVFWGILKLQKGSGTKPVPAGEAAAQQHPEGIMTTSQQAPVTEELEVVFQLDSQSFNLGKVPLIKSHVSAGAVTGAAAANADAKAGSHTAILDNELAKSLVQGIPELPAMTGLKAAQLKTDKKGNPRKIIRGVSGEIIDREGTLRYLLEGAIKARKVGAVKIPVLKKENSSLETFASLSGKLGFRECLSQAETLHKDHIDDDNRNLNLRIAAEKIDGLILQPGEEFGFNRVVGQRSRKAGFCNAGVISNGKIIPGLGGGICQVSTSLYSAALLANMKIVERHNHSIYEGISYAQRGLDAAVSWGSKDFRFVNPLSVPILLSVRAGKGSIHAALYAERRPFGKVELSTRNEVAHPFQTQTRKNSSLKPGEKRVIQPGITGYTVEAYRSVTIKGVAREEPLSKDNYLTFPRIEEEKN
ncbi:hypothetical protein AUK22_07025 [bacterium CG2_30_54_10]|nr:MAG: hypothetical protein AUK22_07025 [bacterium CG2_30_54_10]